jgi:hypothetical protein
MKITLRVSGGFTGPMGAVVREVNLDELPEPDRGRVHRLVEDARVLDRPARAMLASPRSQDLRYVLSVADDHRSNQIELHLDAVDAPMRELVDWIEDEVESVSAIKP